LRPKLKHLKGQATRLTNRMQCRTIEHCTVFLGSSFNALSPLINPTALHPMRS
jgi:hypothetical protein